MAEESRLPNLQIIGAQKAASTSLYSYLIQHPEIYFSKAKEIAFFNHDRKYLEGGLDLYSAFFSEATTEKLVGEASTAYSQHRDINVIVERMYRLDPTTKIIYILRNPIERAYSAYWYNVRDQVEFLSFADAIKTEESRENTTFRSDPYSYKRRGLYVDVLDAYLSKFPADNIHVLLSEDLKKNPAMTCQDIFDFLGVSEFRITNSIDANKSAQPKSALAHRILNHPNWFRSAGKRFLVSVFGEAFRYRIEPYFQRIRASNLEKFEYPEMEDTIRFYLRDYFRDSISELSIRLNRDLSHWD
jgi:hypothetical protein